MELPKVKSKKLVNKKAFIKLAEKVNKIFEEEEKNLLEKKMKYGDNLSTHIHSRT